MATSIRNLPRWQLVQRLKRAGITQWEVGNRVGVSTSFVNEVIARRKPQGNAKAEEVWRVLEEVLR